MSENIVTHESEVNPISTVTLSSMPHMPQKTRGCPNAILRSSLFGVVAKSQKRCLVRNAELAPLPSYTGIKIYYSGVQLNQGDLDLWMELIHLSQNQNGVGQPVYFSGRSLLRALGVISCNSRAIESLSHGLDRLRFAMVRIETNEWIYGGKITSTRNLLTTLDTAGDRIKIVVDPDVALMFSANSWTQIEIEHRRQLKSQLALWLHGFYLTHQQPTYDLLISTLQQLSGSQSSSKEFTRMLKNAAKELAALNWKIAIKGDRVSVRRPTLQYDQQKTAKALPELKQAKPASKPAAPPAPLSQEDLEVMMPAWKRAEIQAARLQRSKPAL